MSIRAPCVLLSLGVRLQTRTTVIVAHRLSTVRNVDRIAVLDQGRVVEMGTHTDLYARQGIYYSMLQSQLFLEAADEGGASA